MDLDIESCAGWIDHLRLVVPAGISSAAKRVVWVTDEHLGGLVHLQVGRTAEERESRRKVIRERLATALTGVAPSLIQAEGQYRRARRKWGREVLASLIGLADGEAVKRKRRRKMLRDSHVVLVDLTELESMHGRGPDGLTYEQKDRQFRAMFNNRIYVASLGVGGGPPEEPRRSKPKGKRGGGGRRA